jgi:hypothetical protein
MAGTGRREQTCLNKNKRPEAFGRSAGPRLLGKRLTTLVHLPLSLTALFILAASLLIGLI